MSGEENWKENDPLYQYIQETNRATGNGTSFPNPFGPSNRPNNPIYPNRQYRRDEYIPQWNKTQDVAKEFDWTGGQDMYKAMAEGEALMAQQAVTDDFWAALDEDARARMGGGRGGASGGSGVNVQGMIDAVLQQYEQAAQQAQQSKAQAAQGIQSAYDQFTGNVNRNYADYTGAASAAQTAMAERLAQQIAEANSRQSQMQASAASMGQDAAALQALQQGNLGALQASGGFQQDLSQRLAQIVANNQRAIQSGGEMIRQGATGTLENNFNALMNALAAQRDEQVASARSAAYSGGGGGGGKSVSYGDALKEILGEYKTISELEKFRSGGGNESLFSQVSPDKLWESYVNAAQSTDPESQAQAAILQGLLGAPSLRG